MFYPICVVPFEKHIVFAEEVESYGRIAKEKGM